MFLLYLLGCQTSIQFDFLSVLAVFCFEIVVVLLLVVQGSTVCLPTSPSFNFGLFTVPGFIVLLVGIKKKRWKEEEI